MALRVRPDIFFPYKSALHGSVAAFAGLLTLVAAAVSVWYAAHRDDPTAKIILTAAWGAWPPLWFLFEHYIWFDNWESDSAAKRFQDGQKLWAKLWAGVGAIIAVILFKLHPQILPHT